jgi:hypothetical protein
MGAVLMQNSHPIAFFSKPFCPRLRRSSTYIRELHAITTAVKKWRQYLLGHPFIIFTDHQSLKELLTQVVQKPEQQVYLAKLMGYDYYIQYKSGKTNVIADALSRLPETLSGMLLSLSMPNFIFLEHLKLALAACEPFKTLLTTIQTNPSSVPNYKTTLPSLSWLTVFRKAFTSPHYTLTTLLILWLLYFLTLSASYMVFLAA